MTDPQGRIKRVRVAMLGPLFVRAEDGSPVEVTGARLRTLLILLALDPGRVVTTSRLIDGVWGDEPPAEAANALQALVSRLRRTGLTIESRPTGYRLVLDPDDVDTHRFERLAAEGRAASATLREALALWRGPALADAATAPFAQAPIARLTELRLAATGDRIEAELGSGADLVPELESLVAEHPLHERFAGLLMRALARAGRNADALAVYARTKEALADELGADPSQELAALHLDLLRGNLETPPDRVRTNLRNGLTSFVGRDDDLARVTAMVGESRLVTLTGPGGSGKTRLAIETGRTLVDSQPDGVWFVELASVGDGADVAQAVLTAVGLRVQSLVGTNRTFGEPVFESSVDRLAAALSHRALLLVLDNCEHLIAATAALVDRLLGVCPRLRVLATSREPLGITGETLWPVAPLALPPADADATTALTFPAVRLLADRARAVRPDFAVDAATAPAVVHVCRALDGMPLAIELAAARLRTMSLDQLATRLDDRFRLLTGGSRMALPRHQTLRAVVDWSWDLLDDDERILLRRLSVFAGGATLEAVEQVCAKPGLDVLDLLTSLVDKSLVLFAGDRYRLLETIKAYGSERLAEAGETEQTRDAFVDWFLRLGMTAEPHLRRADQLEWLAILEADHDNLHAAVRAAIASGVAATAYRLVANVGWYWWLHGHKTEGSELSSEVIAMPGEEVPAKDRALALCTAALCALDGGYDQAQAVTWFTEAVEIVRTVRYRDHPLLRSIMVMNEVSRALGELSESVLSYLPDVVVDDEDPWVLGVARVMRAHVRLNAGQSHEEAETDFRTGLAAFRSVGERWGMSFTLCSLANLVAWRGEFAEAVRYYEEANQLFAELVTNEDLVRYRISLAGLLVQLGHHDRAMAVMAEAERDAAHSGLPESFVALAHARGDFARLAGDLPEARRQLAIALDLSKMVFRKRKRAVAPQFCALISESCGFAAAASGELAVAVAHHREALDLALESNDAPVIAHVLIGVADVTLRQDEPYHAAVLLGASEGIRGAKDLSMQDLARVTDEIRTALGDVAFTEAHAKGLATTLDTLRPLTDKALVAATP
jgi:predicted ATPase/DNA-binding SARP family transcriptional activator